MEFPIRIIIYISIYLGFFTLAFYFLGFLGKKTPLKAIKSYYVTVIIPAWNEEKALEKTVMSVLNLNYPKNKLEIIIVNDGSTDNTEKIGKLLAKQYKNVKLFTKKNGGKGSAINYGIKRSRGELIASFDADSMVTENALNYMLPYFNNPQVMCVTPAMKVYKPRGILQRVQAIEYDLGIFLRKAFANINAVHVTPGPFSIYRKKFFEMHGGYDEHNITEDMEIAMRIQSLNYKIENSMRAVVYTIAPRKFNALTKQRRRWYFGMIHNLKKYRKIFGRQYGELGILVLPVAIISILTVIIVSGYAITKTTRDWFSQIELYSSINFDFVNNINIKKDLFILSMYKILSEGIVIYGAIFFLIAISMLIFINKRIKSIDKPVLIFLNYIFFMLFYSILFSFWWVISGVYSIFKKDISWR